VELQQVERGADVQPSAKLRHRDAEKRWNARIVPGIEQIYSAGKPLAVR
jgi:hypothetical protein